MTSDLSIRQCNSLVPSLHCQLFIFLHFDEISKMPKKEKKLGVETGNEATL